LPINQTTLGRWPCLRRCGSSNL